MDKFLNVLVTVGWNSMFFDNWSPDFDIIGALPLEVAIIILRKLDGKSLLNAAQVSTRWLKIIKFDRVLRKTVREELARQRTERLKRQMFLSNAANEFVHMAAFCPSAKKPRRTFQASVKTVESKSSKSTKKGSSAAKTLRKLR